VHRAADRIAHAVLPLTLVASAAVGPVVLAARAFGPRPAVVAGVYGVMMFVAGAGLAAAERRAPARRRRGAGAPARRRGRVRP
jgi:hypothetical protein